MKWTTIAALIELKRTRTPVVFAKQLREGAEFLLPDTAAPPALNEVALHAIAERWVGLRVIDGVEWFLEAWTPEPRLLIVGAVQIAQVLVSLARMTGFHVTVIDPRRSFGSAERFPGVGIYNCWPDAALKEIGIDASSAIVTLTHDPKIDDPALHAALTSDAFYIGALGSRKTHANRLGRLRCLGHDAEQLERIRGPVGLNIGAVGAAEIAVSIVAEMIAARRGAPPGAARG